MDTTPVNLLEPQAAMDFAHRLAAVRKQCGLTQGPRRHRRHSCHPDPPLRDRHNQPTLDVLRALATALAVTTDDLVFNADERGPADDTLATLDQLDPDKRASIRALIEGALLRHQARRLSAS